MSRKRRQFTNEFKRETVKLIKEGPRSAGQVTFWHKDYRGDRGRHRPLTLEVNEFIRRYLLHVLPKGFHRIRHYGLLASHVRTARLNHIRTLLEPRPGEPEPPATVTDPHSSHAPLSRYLCPRCGAPMLIIETFTPQPSARDPPRLCEAA